MNGKWQWERAKLSFKVFWVKCLNDWISPGNNQTSHENILSHFTESDNKNKNGVIFHVHHKQQMVKKKENPNSSDTWNCGIAIVCILRKAQTQNVATTLRIFSYQNKIFLNWWFLRPLCFEATINHPEQTIVHQSPRTVVRLNMD